MKQQEGAAVEDEGVPPQQPVEPKMGPARPSLPRTAMFALTLVGFWIYGPIGLFFTYVSAQNPFGASDSDILWLAWVYWNTGALLLIHAVYALLTSPWETRGPGYRGYVVNCIALVIGALLLARLTLSFPELLQLVFGNLQ